MRVEVDGIALEFDEHVWSAVKWDEEKAFQHGIRRLKGTKAVDLLSLARASRWVLRRPPP